MKNSNRVFHAALAVSCILSLFSMFNVAVAQEPPMLINYGVSGSWHEPATSGQGFVFAVFPSNNLLAAYWFTYPVEGGEREWYLATGDINGNSVELTIYQTHNGVFDQPSTVEANVAGSASLDFLSCAAASWSYQIDTLGLSGEIPLERIAPDHFCEQFLATAHTDMVSHSNTWVDIRGDWLFEGCVNLENSDSHGDELFSFTATTAILKIDRYSNPDCQGVHSQQILTLDIQRVDKTLALLEGDEVIANRIIWTDVDSRQEIRQLFYVDDRGARQLLTHGILDSPTDDEGFPSEVHTLFAERVESSQ